MPRYASKTQVTVEKSKEEVMSTLRRYGCDGFGSFERKDGACVVFEIRGLSIQIDVPLPPRADFATTSTGKERSASAIGKEFDQAVKQRWRALLLAIRAKLEAVECGISTIEKEFMPFVVMPDGRTLSEHIQPQLDEYAKSGKAPLLLAGPKNKNPGYP